jgi:hypothetical protein
MLLSTGLQLRLIYQLIRQHFLDLLTELPGITKKFNDASSQVPSIIQDYTLFAIIKQDNRERTVNMNQTLM